MPFLYKFAVFTTIAVAALVAVAVPLDYPPPQVTEIVVKYPSLIVVSATFVGDATVFQSKTGTCGIPFDVTKDMVVAMNQLQMGKNAECGKTIRISYKGQNVTANIVDTCHSKYCPFGSLGLSPPLFAQLAPLDKGLISIEWQFM
ncbi:MAG: RlpA-like double-psi beta-barrel-protein domain-containing protein-containing protein [Benniella sp.]|nr:MAG: RlpA-like double-psi beta-barrel-protein domain-containing protein-containing protein [Benniella sp.]